MTLPAITGYATVWNRVSHPIPRALGQPTMIERVLDRPDAFRRIQHPPSSAVAMIGHEDGTEFANAVNGCLTFTGDEYGLRYRIEPHGCRESWQRRKYTEVVGRIRRGEINGASLGCSGRGITYDLRRLQLWRKAVHDDVGSYPLKHQWTVRTAESVELLCIISEAMEKNGCDYPIRVIHQFIEIADLSLCVGGGAIPGTTVELTESAPV